jgi:hypothetical protein
MLVWALSRLSPFVPTLSHPGPIKGLTPLRLTLLGKTPFHPADALVYFCYGAGLALLAETILHRDVRSFRLFAVFVVVILSLHVCVIDGYLDCEMIFGYLAGIGAAVLISRCPESISLIIGMIFLLAGTIVFEMKPGESANFCKGFNWIPFRYHLDNTLAGIGSILEGTWAFSALSLLWLKQNRMSSKGGLVLGGMALLLLMTFLEWRQLYIPGRTADITQALLAVIGWSWPFLLEEQSPLAG